MCFTTIRLEIVPLALIRIHGLDLLLQTDGDEPSSRLLEETLLDRGLSFNKVFKHVREYHWREVCEGRTHESTAPDHTWFSWSWKGITITTTITTSSSS